MRLTEAASLLTLEVPQSEMGDRRYFSGRLAPVVPPDMNTRTGSLVALAGSAPW